MKQATAPWRSPAWLSALFFGAWSYLSITSFERPSMAYSQVVATHVLAVTAALFIGLLRLGEKLTVPRHLLVPLCLCAVSVLVSWWWAVHRPLATDRLLLYYAVLLLGVATYLLCRKGEPRDTLAYLLAIALVHLFLLVAVLVWLRAVMEGADDLARKIPFHSNIRHFSYHSYLAAAAAASVVLLSRRLLLVPVLLTAAALYGAVILGGRGALYSWLVFVAVLLVITPQRKRFLLASVTALLVAVAAAYFSHTAGLGAHLSLFARAELNSDVLYRSAGRLPIWRDAAHAILAHPGFGYGPEGYVASHCCNPATVQPHSFVLQFLMEFGVVGCMLLGVLVWRVQKAIAGAAGWRARLATSEEVRVLVAILAGFFVYAAVDGLLYHAVPLFHFAVLVALLAAAAHRAAQAMEAPGAAPRPA
ncbi:O-antigen ligase family protein [Caldimonas thermodepolymerans]|nr:O-antigen ligase family protein [Caldimonas thermodepolymerans]